MRRRPRVRRAGVRPAVAQDADSGDVLMLPTSPRKRSGRPASRGRPTALTLSGENSALNGWTSGHTQAVKEVRVDCDADALLYIVDQTGGACHTGYESCFYRTVDGETVGEQVFDPDDVY